MHGYFRWKSILVLLVLCAVVSAAWFVAHRFQVRSLNARFLEQATRDEASGNLDRAARFYRLYLFLRSDDVEARMRSAKLKEKRARNGAALRDALGDYEDVLLRDKVANESLLDPTTRTDIRLRTARLYLVDGKTDDALGALGRIEKKDRAKPDVQFLLGECYRLQQEFAKAKECYWSTVKGDSKKLEAYVLLASLLGSEHKKKDQSKKSPQQDKGKEQDTNAMPTDPLSILDRLVAENADNYRAFLMRAEFRRVTNDSEKNQEAIDRDLLKARELAPNDANVLLASASMKVLLARRAESEKEKAALLADARSFLQHAADRNPKDPRILSARVHLEVTDKRVAEAADLMQRGLKTAIGKERDRLLWELATVMIDNNNIAQARETLAAIEKSDPKLPYINSLQGKILMKEGRWSDASEKLEAARVSLETATSTVVDTSALILNADLLLAECARQLLDTDKRLRYLRRAKKSEFANAAVRFSLTTALMEAGRLEEADDECERLRKMARRPDEFAVTTEDIEALYARLLLRKTLILPPSSRRWDETEARLERLAESHPQLADLQIRRAEAAAAQGNFKQARAILDKAKEKSPKAIGCWTALASLASMEGNKSEALQILDQAHKNFGSDPSIFLSKLRFVPETEPAKLDFLRLHKADLDSIPPTLLAAPLQFLAAAFESAGDKQEAEQLWLRLAELEKRDLAKRESLFSFYERTQNIEGMTKTLRAIQDIEGKGGPLGHFGEAQLLMFKAFSKDNAPTDAERQSLLAAARQQLVLAGASRPLWPRVPELLAMIAEDNESAIKHLREAVFLGNRNPVVLRQFIAKLVESGMNSDADDLLRKLQESGPISSDLRKIAAEVSVFNQNEGRAFDLTNTAVAKDSKDYTEFLWQGRVLGALGKYLEAETSLLRSIELAGEAPEPWVALVEIRARSGARDKATATLEEFEKRVKAKPLSDKSLLALAQANQSIGKKDRAEKLFRQVMASRPDDWEVLQAGADFYRSNSNLDKAQPILRELIDPKMKAPKNVLFLARRNLALALGSQNDPEKLSDALVLIEENLKANRLNIDDKIVKGTLLAMKSERRQEAIDILRETIKLRPPRAEQLLLLSSLYDTKGNWRDSRSSMLQLLTSSTTSEKHAAYLAMFIGKLLAHDEINEAQFWLQRLVELRPHSFVTLERRSRINAIQGRASEILDAVKDFLDSNDSEQREFVDRLALSTQLLANISSQYSSLSKDSAFNQKCEEMLKSYVHAFVKKTGKRDSMLVLADFAARTQRLENCHSICESLITELPARLVVGVAVSAIANNNATAGQINRVESWINAEKKKSPSDVEWLLFSAILNERRQRFDEAERLYRAALGKAPGSLLIMNNLGYLLGLLGKDEEALRLIDFTVERSARNGEMLDSRAAILLAKGKHREAEADLREALAQERTATRLFHLAQLEYSSGNAKKATDVFEEAKRRGLRIDLVHPLEREIYQRIEREAETKRKLAP